MTLLVKSINLPSKLLAGKKVFIMPGLVELAAVKQD
jgi:hypothetical protein